MVAKSPQKQRWQRLLAMVDFALIMHSSYFFNLYNLRKMNTYVKIECELQGIHPNWFLEYTGSKNLVEDLKLNDKMQERRIKERLILSCSWSHGIDKGNARSHLDRLILTAAKSINYSALYQKYNQPLYIREKGSYMTLSDGTKIINRMQSNFFPKEENLANIVICENDRVSEYEWEEYLKNRFPNKTIKTANFFNSRTDEEIKEYFKGAELITFSTTFSDFAWFENAIRNKEANQKIIGYSHCPEKWEQAKGIYSDIEIIHSL